MLLALATGAVVGGCAPFHHGRHHSASAAPSHDAAAPAVEVGAPPPPERSSEAQDAAGMGTERDAWVWGAGAVMVGMMALMVLL